MTESLKRLDLICLIDTSGSMKGRKIAALNQLFIELIPQLRREIEKSGEIVVTVRVLRFADRPEWHIGPEPIALDEFEWHGLNAAGDTATAAAIRLLTTSLSQSAAAVDGPGTLCILVTDGYCSDPRDEYLKALADFRKSLNGKLPRLAVVAVGDSTEYDEVQLRDFLGGDETGLVRLEDPEAIVRLMRDMIMNWVGNATLSPQGMN
jgi:uncharacterized protein YegL